MVQIPVWVQRPENQAHWCPKAGEDGCPSKSVLLLLSVPFRPPREWMLPTHTSEGATSLLNLLIQMLTSSRNIYTDTPRSHVPSAIWVSLSSAKCLLGLTAPPVLSWKEGVPQRKDSWEDYKTALVLLFAKCHDYKCSMKHFYVCFFIQNVLEFLLVELICYRKLLHKDNLPIYFLTLYHRLFFSHTLTNPGYY